MQFYPPADSPYLFLSIERQQPTDGGNTLDVPVKLWRGVMVEGRITDRATQQPIEGAIVSSRQQHYRNLLYHRGSDPFFSGTRMSYASDAEGRFRLSVWPGRGYLLVDGPTDDYLHTMISDGDLYYGESGLQRNYHDAAVRINFKSSETPAPLAIELERGVTLRRNVICPDGQPASGKAFARSYLSPDRKAIDGYSQPIEIIDGKIELPGFGPEQSNPLFLIDLAHHCGAMVSPSASEVELTSPPIQLLPCGAAKFRFVNDDNEPLADYEPWLHLMITPGAPATHHIEADQPLWSDTIIWQNVARPAKVPKADAEGRVEVTDLIPGATYSVGYVNKDGRWDDGYEFTVRSGETVDVGEVVIPKHK